ncbi:ATP-binding protein [Candidatus Woesearchaeota archaeon]|nr:ATP-binding protein [Candidatus Woesearchaeota archaeon]
MNETDLINNAKHYIVQGQQLERKEPEVARKSFLAAAHMLVNASKSTTVTESKQRYVDVANALYWRAHAIEGSVVEEGSSDSEPDERIKSMLIAKPGTRFKDIAGLSDVKDEIKLKIIEPFKHPEIFKKYGKRVGGGVLMFGPPGCGKSLLAEATAGEADVAFFNVKASDLKSKFVGETERNIAALFKAARGQPNGAIIFFDEFEALGGERGTAGAHDRNFVSQLLTEMDSVGNKDQKILLIAATNLPWNVDLALRREGRFGVTVFVPPPDAEAREHILQLHLRDKPAAKDIDLHQLAGRTDGFSGADIKALCESATDIPLKEYLATKRARDITMEDFKTALSKRVATTQPWFGLAIRNLKQCPDDELAKQILAHAPSTD